MSNSLLSSVTSDVTTPAQKHLGSLIILRGLAALAVCCCHFGGALRNEGEHTFVYNMLNDYGEYGVHVFFVVSGFVVPFSLFNGSYHLGHFITFLKKRVSRLQIPYMAALILTVILVYATSIAKQEVFSVTALSFMQNSLYLKMIPENPVFWSLKVEAQYYVYIGLFYGLIIKFPRIFVALLIPATLLLQYIPGIELSLWEYLVYFNIGIIGFMIYSGIGQKMLNVIIIIGLSIFIFIQDIPAMIAAISSLLFILYYQSSVPKPLKFLGTISYSLYLIHFPIGIKFINLLNRFIPSAYSPLLMLAALVLVIVLATIFYHFVENPAERISKSFRYAPEVKENSARFFSIKNFSGYPALLFITPTQLHIVDNSPQKTALITGAAGFLGSHLSDRFLAEGIRVIGMDNLLTGSMDNIAHLMPREDFTFFHHDVSTFVHVPGKLDYILHFASPASPIDYLKMPIQTLKVGSLGTHNLLGLAKAKGARMLIASTSEVYGDPLVHPQHEQYWGNVNPVGPRGVYDEAKRFQEAMTMAYHTYHGLETRIVRIFNTYGPRMRINDGRVLPAFISQAIRGEGLTIFGDGSQTRSFCYVDDLVEGIYRLLLSDYAQPVNVGNTAEISMVDFAKEILDLVGNPQAFLDERPLPIDDPKVRQPDISLARKVLNWEPKVDRAEGLRRTLPYFLNAVQSRQYLNI